MEMKRPIRRVEVEMSLGRWSEGLGGKGVEGWGGGGGGGGGERGRSR